MNCSASSNLREELESTSLSLSVDARKRLERAGRVASSIVSVIFQTHSKCLSAVLEV
jgi:hypothetical protein